MKLGQLPLMMLQRSFTIALKWENSTLSPMHVSKKQKNSTVLYQMIMKSSLEVIQRLKR